MNQLTIRGFDKQVEDAIRSLAEREKISLNKAALRILHHGIEFMEPDAEMRKNVIGNTLDHLAGTWSDDEVRRMDEAERDFENIDSELWP